MEPQDTAKHGESSPEKPEQGEWGRVERDSRLHIPKDISSAMSWYKPGERREVVIELRERGAIRIHRGERRADLDQQRRKLSEGFEDQEEARRRIEVDPEFGTGGLIGA